MSLVFVSNLLHIYVLPSVLCGAGFCSGSVPAVRFLDGATRRWSHCLLAVASRVSRFTWNLVRLTFCGLSLVGCCPSSGALLPCSPLPDSVSRVMASFPESLLASCTDLCDSLEIVTPSSFGVAAAPFSECVNGSLSVLSLVHSVIDC